MRVGIVGYSQSGKSTLFQAMTGIAPDPSKVMKGQMAIAKVEDERLAELSRRFTPKKTTTATVEFIDTPGLIRGERADNPARIATLRNADGLMVVLDGFSPGADPVRDLREFREELLFADLSVVTNRIEKVNVTLTKKNLPAKQRELDEAELADLKAIAERLENGQRIEGMSFTEQTLQILKSFQLFSGKPEIAVLNLSESNLDAALPSALVELAPGVVQAAAKLELDLEALEGDERAMFMEELGVTELAKPRVIRAAYDAVGLISFFTVGEDECKAWTIKKGTNAVDAAGKIHSDLSRGFIRAEVVAYDDMIRLGGMKEVKAAGLHRLEGKEYVVLDGDIINFRSGV